MALAKTLTISGSVPGGGAGIQAVLKTFTVLGTYGMSVLTALTAQNTLGVSGVHAVPPAFVKDQLDAVLSDLGTDAAKTGMLFDVPIIEVVADRIRHYGLKQLVLDPVMIAKGGHPLLLPQAQAALRDLLLPLAAVVTPNLPEAEVLAGMTITTKDDMVRAGRRLLELGAGAAVIKGGHLENGPADDVLVTPDGLLWLEAERVESRHTHGTGCTFSAAIAAGLAKGMDNVNTKVEKINLVI